jgi:hypothetical protein
MFTRANNIKVELPRAAIEAIFDECDRYNVDETGGRILGTYNAEGNALSLAVNGVIEPGPNAQRTQTYFKQDGDYQEKVFRQVEDHMPSIEHLGNWHTHHVNGLRHLSGGDIDTYRRTVAHANQNTQFFYALLVTEKMPGKTGLDRYVFKNYLLRRGDEKVYEIPASAVTLVDAPLVWPTTKETMLARRRTPPHNIVVTNADLVHDQDAISQFFPKVKALQSKDLGIYWRGGITLADGSDQEVVVLRDTEAAVCSVTLRNPQAHLEPVTKALEKNTFSSARAALIATERACNAQLVAELSHKRKRGRLWMF